MRLPERLRVYVGLLVWAALIGFAQTRRVLTPDEAYYLCAARSSHPIVDHPPLLGWLLRLADAAVPWSVEARVRLVPLVCWGLSIVAIGALADELRLRCPIQPAREGEARRWASFLSATSLVAVTSAVAATPDAPQVTAITVLLWIGTRRHHRVTSARRTTAEVVRLALELLALFLLSAVAMASKVAALVALLPMSLALARRDRMAALAVVSGTCCALPLALPSLGQQTAHVLGRGPLVSAPYVGALPAMLAVIPTLIAVSPIPWCAFRSASKQLALLRLLPGGVVSVWGVVALMVLSGAWTGRPPEPSWITPVLPALLATLAVAMSEVSADAHAAKVTRATHLGAWRWQGQLPWVHLLPTMLAWSIWCWAPDAWEHTVDPLRRAPRSVARLSSVGEPLPRYARASWRCVYGPASGGPADDISKRSR